MADQANVLPDLPVPTKMQQDTEPVQNPPQRLELITEPAPVSGPADKVNSFFLVCLMRGVSLATFSVGYFLLSLVSVFSLVV